MTQSADDGHIARGSYVFGIGSVGPEGTAQGPSSGISTLPNNQQQRVQTVAVTSNLDGLIKWPLIVSEVVIVGGIFSHSFLWEKFGNRIGKKSITRKVSESEAGFNTTTIPWVKRFSLVLVIASATIIACATSLLFLQITELLTNSTSNSNYRLIFESILHGSSGISCQCMS